MIIGIDASRANKPQKTGTEWYSYHLIKALAEIDDKNKYLLYLNKPAASGLKNLGKNFEEKVLNWPLPRLWTQGRLSREMLFNSPDVLFVPAHVIPLIHPPKSIVTIHDIGFAPYPEIYSWKDIFYHKWAIYWAAKRAHKIITVSEFSKNELVRVYNINPEAVKVIPLSYNKKIYRVIEDKDKIEEILHKYKIDKPYLLFIGRLEQKKNVLSIIESFKILKSTNPDLKLVLIGRPGYKFEEIEKKIKEYDLSKDIIMPGWVSSAELPYLLNAAEVFVFPSFYEGFGIPILEAMACGTPVISSNITSIPEVAGRAALLVNPNNNEELIQGIKKLLEDKDLRQNFIDKGLERVKEFSWRKCAESTLQVFIAD